MNHERKKVFQELEDDRKWYCPTCMFRWGGEEPTCPVCGDDRQELNCSEHYVAFYRCSKCRISILQIDVEVKTVDDVKASIDRTCPICKEQTIHELDSTKKRKMKHFQKISDIAEEALRGRG
jgi:rubrerythrin